MNLFGHKQSISQSPKYPQIFIVRHSFRSYGGLPLWDGLPCDRSLAHLTNSRHTWLVADFQKLMPDSIRYDAEGYLGAQRANVCNACTWAPSLASRFTKDISCLHGSGTSFWQLWSNDNSSVETAINSRHIVDLSIFWNISFTFVKHTEHSPQRTMQSQSPCFVHTTS